MQEHPHWIAASLLLLPILQRLVQLHVQTCHHLTSNLGERRLVWILRLVIRPTQTDKPLLQLDLLRLRKAHLRFRRELLRDRVGAYVNSADEKFITVEEEDMGRLGSNVQHHRASLNIAVIVAEGVNHCRLRRVH